VPDSPVDPRNDPRQTLEELRPWIMGASAALSRRYGLDADEADDLASCVMEKLIENDYAALRKYRGESSLTTFLTIVIANIHRDNRVQKWGRWRPSATARRLGALAIRLETLLRRDGHRLDEAIEIVRSSGETATPAEIRAIAARLPVRSPPRRVDRHVPADVSAAERADDGLMDGLRNEAMDRANEALDRALARLPAEDRIILRLHIREALSVADIARSLGIAQKPLYRRIERDKRELRSLLEAEGVTAATLREWFDDA
jgi:RNA polymerase sigma factor for flagellar operon FliA